MSDHLHPEVHPDADSLSAFLEGVLPEHERAQCLAHLAECSRCREIVFLAQNVPVAPARQRWFRPMPLLAAAAMVCVALLGAWLYLRSRTAAPPRELAQAIPLPPATPDIPAEKAAPKPVERKPIPLATRRSQPEPKAEVPPQAPVTVPAPVTVRESAPIPTPPPAPRVAVLPPPKPPAIVIQKDAALVEALSGISGIDRGGDSTSDRSAPPTRRQHYDQLPRRPGGAV
jgi:outer membrane biosynthesis protein TonB